MAKFLAKFTNVSDQTGTLVFDSEVPAEADALEYLKVQQRRGDLKSLDVSEVKPKSTARA